MKHVFSDAREVAHLWMSQSQDSARSAGPGNFYFRGSTIYSYGSHFPIARIVANATGDRAILLTTRTYSVTTARHISMVRRAIDSALPVFHVARPDGSDFQGQFLSYSARLTDVVESIKPRMRAETKLRLFGDIQTLVTEANAFALFAGLTTRIEMPDSLETVVGNLETARRNAAELAERERVKREAKYKRDTARYRAEHAEHLATWRATGETHYTRTVKGAFAPYERTERLNLSAWPGDLLRVDETTGEIETSRGARVPLSHAERAYRFIAALKAKKKTFQTNGHTFHIGPYRLDSVDAKGNIKAGCHTITWSEILQIAARMDWTRPAVQSDTDTTVNA